MVVRDALSSPYATDVVLAFAQNLHLPHLFGVGNGDALATVGIAVDFDEPANQADGIAGGRAALQGYTFQLLDKEHAGGIAQGVGTTERALADGQLMLIETGVCRVEVGIGVCGFWDGTHKLYAGSVATERGVQRTFVHGVNGSGFMVGGGFHVHPGAVATIAGVRSDDAAVA